MSDETPDPRDGMYDWPRDARDAVIAAIDARTGAGLQVTAPVAVCLATDILNAVVPLIRAAERDRIIKLASGHKAICVCLCGMAECGDERPVHARKFADFIRERGEPQ